MARALKTQKMSDEAHSSEATAMMTERKVVVGHEANVSWALGGSKL